MNGNFCRFHSYLKVSHVLLKVNSTLGFPVSCDRTRTSREIVRQLSFFYTILFIYFKLLTLFLYKFSVRLFSFLSRLIELSVLEFYLNIELLFTIKYIILYIAETQFRFALRWQYMKAGYLIDNINFIIWYYFVSVCQLFSTIEICYV